MADGDGALPRVLVPYHAAEAATIKEAAGIARKSPGTIRAWAASHDIGRHVAGGGWQISRVALQMLLDGDRRALKAYLAGDRSTPLVVHHYQRLGISLPASVGGQANAR